MADDPGNLVLVILREIRADLTEVKAKIVDHDARFDKLDKGFEQFKMQSTYALGLATASNMQCMHTEARVEEIEARQKELATAFAKLQADLRLS